MPKRNRVVRSIVSILRGFPSAFICSFGVFSLVEVGRAQENAANSGQLVRQVVADEPVALPPFVVETAATSRPWRYLRTGEVEILSRSSDAITINVALRYRRLHELLRILLPDHLQVVRDQQETLILYDEGMHQAASREIVSEMKRRAETSRSRQPAQPDTAPADLRASLIEQWEGAKPRESAETREAPLLPNMRLSDLDMMAACVLAPGAGFDANALRLQSGYVGDRLRNRVPALPSWFIAGFLRLFNGASFLDNSIEVEPLVWKSGDDTRATKVGGAHDLRPLNELLEMNPGSSSPSSDIDLWFSQAELFVRWGLDSAGGQRRESFFKFVDRSAAQGADESLFTECFGVGSDEATNELRRYLGSAVRRGFTCRGSVSSRDEPSFQMRNATRGEVARIKGDFERLQVSYVRKRFPDFEAKYLRQARQTLERAYSRGSREPALLAVMGLCEFEAGERAKALQYLNEAVRGGVVRPRAHLELGRLRYEQELNRPKGPTGKLSEAQVRAVLEPLLAALDQAPRLPEAYQLMSEVWMNSDVRMTLEDVAPFREGLTLFRKDAKLVQMVTRMLISHGYSEEEMGRMGRR